MKFPARNTTNQIITILMTGLISIVPSLSFARTKYIPVVQGNFSTGQWYFEGEPSSLGGNAHLTFVPAVQFSNRFSLLPTLMTSYRGTRSAEELAGGTTLFQDTWESSIGIKGVHGLGRHWKWREKVGFRTKLFRETTDESLGDGLYDYRIYNIGTEIERSWSKKYSIALGYDYSFLRFPNYVSLESTQSDDLAREFAGDDVLDEHIQLLSLRSSIPTVGKIQTQLQGFYSPRRYTDQHVVNLTGLLTAEKRKEQFLGATLSLERVLGLTPKTYLLTNINVGYTGMDSNQNHYDARLTKFVADFYDYDQRSIGTQLSLAFNTNPLGPMIFDMSASYSKRYYRHRKTQNENGSYLNDNLYEVDKALMVGFNYPLAKYFRLRVTANFGRSRSNTTYEEVYRYNYNNANYQFGFTYDY